ncbi:MAG TPA: hypothetical protein DEH78_07225 [Solibacterales bacterium]|nr:hypothetical protein [Bryobacterales bacterium]
MHHVVLEEWSRGATWLHNLDARAKLAAALAFLISLSLTPPSALLFSGAAVLALGVAGALAARLPVHRLLFRSAVVVPFSASVAAVSWFAGDPARAVALLVKSYLSAVIVLLAAATTPMPALLHGLRSLGLPALLTLVIQFVYRYLFVISEQAQHMRLASASRLGPGGFRVSAGAVAVLFARSQARAERIHWAMLARGGGGPPRPLAVPSFRLKDALFAATAVLLAAVLILSAKRP